MIMMTTKEYSDLVSEIDNKIISLLQKHNNDLKNYELEHQFKIRTNRLREGYLINNLNTKLELKLKDLEKKYQQNLTNYRLNTDKDFLEEYKKAQGNEFYRKNLNKLIYKYKNKDTNSKQEFEKNKQELKELVLKKYQKEVNNLNKKELSEPVVDTITINKLTEKANQKISKISEKYQNKAVTLTAKYNIMLEKLKLKQKAEVEKLYLERDKIIDEEKLSIEKIEHDISNLSDVLEEDVLLQVKNLTMKFGGLVAVNNLSFDIKKGEIFGLIGPNGAGKTTVFNCITKFYQPSSGEILFRRNENAPIVNIINEKVHNVIKHGIARTFQNVEVVYELTVLENLMVGSHSRFNANIIDVIFKTSKLRYEEGIVYQRAIEILEKFDLIEYINFYPSALPYGVLKKLEFARSLMSEPNLIILDEPAAGLNEMETKELSQLILDIRDNFNVTILLVEHDMGLVMSISDRICAINFGKELVTGTPSVVQNNKDVKIAYLGGDY